MTKMTMKEFKQSMKGEMLEFNNEQLETIYNAIDFEGFETIEEVKDHLDIETWEDNGNGDFTLYQDVNLSSLLEDLRHNGMNEDYIVTLINAHYGNCIDLIYCKEDGMFVMAVGVR